MLHVYVVLSNDGKNICLLCCANMHIVYFTAHCVMADV